MTSSTRSHVGLCAVIGALAALLYLALPTQQYSGDGIRWYGPISSALPNQLSGTNHLLYVPLARAYFSLATTLGATPSWTLAQSMNALFAGGALACFAFIAFAWTRHWPITLAATLALGLSRAFSQHAVDMTEPMSGAFFALLAMALVSALLTRDPARRWLLALAGLSVGIGTSIYQSNMFAVVGACAFLVLVSKRRPRERLIDSALLVGVAGATALSLYVLAFLTIGNVASVADALRQSLVTENELTNGIYAEFGLRRALVLVFGFADAVFGMKGIGSALPTRITPEVAFSAMLFVLAWACALTICGVFAWLLATKRLAARSPYARAVLACLVWLAPQLALQLFFGARYSKLWMSSLATIVLALAIMVRAMLDHRAERLARVGVAAFFGGLVAPVVVFGLSANMIPDRVRPNLVLEDQRRAQQFIRRDDLVVGDWGGLPYDPVPTTESAGIVPIAMQAKLDSSVAAEILRERIRDTQSAGRDVYFYGMLDLDGQDWQIFWGERLELPPSFLDEYRARAKPVFELSTRTQTGNAQHVWKLDPPLPR